MQNLMRLSREEFADFFPHHGFTVKHNLVDHPLFALPRLIELSKSLPSNSFEYNSGKIPVSQDPTKTPRNGLSVDETIARIENCSSWMALKNVEQDSEYQKLMNTCLDEIGEYSVDALGPMLKREAFIFISSPGSVTPYHIDPEHNFLLQIRGTKTVYMFDGNNRDILSEKQLEDFHAGAHRNMHFRDEYQEQATAYNLTPGLGLHFPVTDPHWVKNGDQVSISLSITFRSAYSERRAKLYFLNAKMRKMGLNPAPVGQRTWLDTMKYSAFRLGLKAKSTIFGEEQQQSRY